MKIGALWAHQISFGPLFLPMCYHWWELHVDDLVSHKKDGRDSRVQRLRACEGGAFSLAKKEPLKVCIPKINIDLKLTLCTTCIHLEAPNVCMWYVVLVLGWCWFWVHTYLTHACSFKSSWRLGLHYAGLKFLHGFFNAWRGTWWITCGMTYMTISWSKSCTTS